MNNEMAFRRRNIESRCKADQKQVISENFEALNFFPVVGKKSINAAPLIDTERLYVLKYRYCTKYLIT